MGPKQKTTFLYEQAKTGHVPLACDVFVSAIEPKFMEFMCKVAACRDETASSNLATKLGE